MKNVKNDTKYIIKRILIGVGIAIILFNLKKCNAYALSSTYNIGSKARDEAFTFSTSDLPSGNYLVNSYNVNDIDFNFYFSVKNVYTDVLFFIIEYNGKNYMYATYYKKNPDTDYNNISYYGIHPSTTSLDYPPNLIAYTSDGSYFGNFASTTNVNMTQNYTDSFRYRFYEIDLENVTRKSKTSSDKVLSYNILTNGNVIYTNYDKPLKVNNNTIIEPDTDPLANYTKVDLTGYQAILIVPKNYPYLLSEYGFESEETNANNPQIHYNIGYEKCVKPTLIELNNFKNFSINTTLNSDPTSEYELNSYCSDTPELYTQNYPIYNLRAEEQPSYYYMGILVYNNSTDYSQNTPDWINNQQNPYGQSFVYVEEEFYNYYLVENFSTFNQSLSYKDFNLEDQTTNINSLPTFNGLVDGSLSSIDTPLGQNMNFQYFLDFVKFPYNFLKSFITGTCEPITLPLPHLGNMQLPCMSTIYSQFIPASLINLLSIVINGLLFWRFTLSNIHSLQDVLQPEDTELEVWSL